MEDLLLIVHLLLFCYCSATGWAATYVADIQRIAAGDIDAAANAAMAASLTKAKWAVVGIWAGLIVAAVLGVTKPG